MYYESRRHTKVEVSSARQAILRIEAGEPCNSALVWRANGRTLCVVDDSSIHTMRSWFEVAVIDLRTMKQIESITLGWCEDTKEKVNHLRECETTDFAMTGEGAVRLPLDGKGDEVESWFECGCCGEGFQSTIKKQEQFDQDTGFGICKSCGGIA